MKRVLIIDDEMRIQDIYLRFLIQAGLIVRRAGDAQAATNILIREDIDLYLLDIKMPGINGRGMFEIIKEYHQDAKIMIISVYPIEKQKRLIPHANAYYDKSEGPINLLGKVMNLLDLWATEPV